MKTIGLIGGMSWESTVTYYKIINETVKKELGGLHSSKCILYSVDFDEIEKCQSCGDWDRSGDILGQAARSLEKAGADFIVICTNTMHKVAPRVQSYISIPLLHIADVTTECLKSRGIRTVALLGTRYTCLLYTSHLKNIGKSQRLHGRTQFARRHLLAELSHECGRHGSIHTLAGLDGADDLEYLGLVRNGPKGAVHKAHAAGYTFIIINIRLAVFI